MVVIEDSKLREKTSHCFYRNWFASPEYLDVPDPNVAIGGATQHHAGAAGVLDKSLDGLEMRLGRVQHRERSEVLADVNVSIAQSNRDVLITRQQQHLTRHSLVHRQSFISPHKRAIQLCYPDLCIGPV
jgi:hypothetical protein